MRFFEKFKRQKPEKDGVNFFKDDVERHGVQQVVSVLREDPRVSEIKLTGSTVDGKPNSKRGDMDFLVVKDDAVSFQRKGSEGIDVIITNKEEIDPNNAFTNEERGTYSRIHRSNREVVQDMYEKGITVYKRSRLEEQ